MTKPNEGWKGERLPGRGRSMCKVPEAEGVWVLRELEDGQSGGGTRNEAGEGGASPTIQDFGAECVGKRIKGDWKGRSEADLKCHT